VLEIPSEVLGPMGDGWFRWVTDVGITGPDKGKGGILDCPIAQSGDTKLKTSSAASRIGGASQRATISSPQLPGRHYARWGTLLDQIVSPDPNLP
jgi:hypothetical protein